MLPPGLGINGAASAADAVTTFPILVGCWKSSLILTGALGGYAYKRQRSHLTVNEISKKTSHWAVNNRISVALQSQLTEALAVPVSAWYAWYCKGVIGMGVCVTFFSSWYEGRNIAGLRAPGNRKGWNSYVCLLPGLSSAFEKIVCSGRIPESAIEAACLVI